MTELLEGSESVVQINEHKLDKECIRLPGDYLKFAHNAADLKRDVGEVKAELDVVQADLSKEIRANPEDFGIEKLTEGALKEAVQTNPRYQKTLARLNRAQHRYDLAQAVVWALEHKKRTLTLLVDLHGMGYFSSPKVSKEGREAVEQQTQAAVRRRHQRNDDEE